MQMRAGSLVINQKKELLLIYRKGKWDFPKGKVEKKVIRKRPTIYKNVPGLSNNIMIGKCQKKVNIYHTYGSIIMLDFATK